MRRTGEEKGEEIGGKNQMAKSMTLTARAAMLISNDVSAIMICIEYTPRRLINP